ncbi:hypothetical protein Zmor_015569 [Zophobas morio]|uniref:Uncharacterized protein n=1 Tax=Zophobas morio TaxID=2755281 RepID=A0AA38MHA8_9CUCU|nr:hypothetical protein Zmor_015569 [Zophobas morio]
MTRTTFIARWDVNSIPYGRRSEVDPLMDACGFFLTRSASNFGGFGLVLTTANKDITTQRFSARPRQTSHFELHSDRIQKARDEDFEQLVFLKTPSKPIGSIVTFSGSHQARNVLALPHSVNLNGINAQTAQNILLGYVAGAGRVFITKISLKCHVLLRSDEKSRRFSVCIAYLNADGREEISKEKISQWFRSGDCTGQWGGANFPFQHCGKILVQINIYASCMAGDLVLDVKDLLQMPHPSSPRKYLLS